MSEMVERVAKAIFAVQNYKPWDGLEDNNPYRLEALECARAAIAEMRDPSDGMIKCGNEFANMPPDTDSNMIRFAYSAMINEALK